MDLKTVSSLLRQAEYNEEIVQLLEFVLKQTEEIEQLKAENKELRSKLREIALIAFEKGGGRGRTGGKLDRIKAIVVEYRD